MTIKELIAKLCWKKQSTENTKAIHAKDALGIKGEKLAVNHLKEKGFKIIGERVHVGIDELDIIAIDFSNPMTDI